MISANYIFYSVPLLLILFLSFSEGEMGAAGVSGHKGPQVSLGQIICINSHKFLFLLLGFD